MATEPRILEAADVPEYRIHTRQSPLERTRTAIEIVAILATAVWAVYTFVYQERIKSSLEPPRMIMVPSVTHTALNRDHELVTVTAFLKNTGSVPVEVAGLALNVTAVRFADTVREFSGTDGSAGSGEEVAIRGLPVARRDLVYRRAQLQSPFGEPFHVYVQPGVDTRPAFSFALKRGEYDGVQVTYAICYVRADQSPKAHLILRPPAPGRPYDIRTFAVAEARAIGAKCGRLGPATRPIDPL